MRKIFYSGLLGVSALVFSSCIKTENTGTVSYTYNKAVAQYANINDVRNTPVNGSIQAVLNPEKIYFGSDFVLIGEKDKGIHIYDNTNNSFQQVGFIQLPFAQEFSVKDHMVYVESQYDLVKIDISNLSQPTLVNRLEYAFSQPILNDNGEVLMGFDYVLTEESFELNSPEENALRNSNFLYFDYNNNLIPESNVPSAFVGAGEKGTFNRLISYNNNIYAIGNTKLYTFSDNGTLSRTDEDYVPAGAETVITDDNGHLYVGGIQDVHIFNISNPDQPNKNSTFTHREACDPVLPYNNVAYLTLRSSDFDGCGAEVNTLTVIDISNTYSPREVKNIDLNSPYGMMIRDNKLWVAQGANGFSVYDISDRLNPYLVHENTSLRTYDINIHPNNSNIILFATDNGLEQYQLEASTYNLTKLSEITF